MRSNLHLENIDAIMYSKLLTTVALAFALVATTQARNDLRKRQDYTRDLPVFVVEDVSSKATLCKKASDDGVTLGVSAGSPSW